MKNLNKQKVILVGILLVILVGISVGAGYFSRVFSKIDKVNLNEEKLGINKEEENKEIKNIALFGIDSEEMEGRSDAIMILTLDGKHNKFKLTSVMRDSYVNIDGYGMDKINHAYAYGGAELAIKTLNENFGLNIEDFIAVNFESIKEIVNALGGVNINISEEEVSHISGITEAGFKKLNGEQALQYSRIRYASGGDAMRTQRHRNIISSLYESFKYTELKEYPEIINKLVAHVKTSFSSRELIDLGSKFYTELNGNLQEERFPLEGEGKELKKDNVFYLQYDLEKAKNQMREYIYNDIKPEQSGVK